MNTRVLATLAPIAGSFLILTATATAQPVRVFGPPARGTARPPLWINLNPHARPNSSTGTAAPPYTPQQVSSAYGFNQVYASGFDGAGEVIGIVDAYDDSANIQNDLNYFCNQFGLPPTTVQIIYAQGTKPSANTGWQQEESLDVEWAHAIAPGAKILLVEAYNNSTAYLLQAAQVAVQNGATVVSMSWGGGESSGETSSDAYFTSNAVTYVASAGDSGESTGVEWPATSPNVIGVGGTTLVINSDGTYGSESAWASSGGGISTIEPLPSWQTGWSSYLGNLRGVPDVSYLADPNYGVYVRYNGGWYEFGGTSVGAPQWAALVALANQQRGAGLPTPGQAIYSVANNGQVNGLYTINPNYFHDVTSGNNGGDPDDQGIFGYDLVTGVGSPLAGSLVPALATWGAAPPTPDFSLSITPSSATVSATGGQTNYTVTVTPLSGFSGTVDLSLGSMPSGVTPSWTAVQVDATTTVATTLTLTVAPGTSVGSYGFSVTGTSTTPSLTHQASATLAVAHTPTTMTVSSISYSTSGRRNSNLNITLTVVDSTGNPVSGASVSITLDLNGSPYASGTASTGSNGQVTLQLTKAPRGTYHTVVTSVTASGLTWDNGYPTANSFYDRY